MKLLTKLLLILVVIFLSACSAPAATPKPTASVPSPAAPSHITTISPTPSPTEPPVYPLQTPPVPIFTSTPKPWPAPTPTPTPLSAVTPSVIGAGRPIISLPSVEKAVLFRINQYRIKNSIKPTEEDQVLYAASTKSTRDMALKSQLLKSEPASPYREIAWSLVTLDAAADEDIAKGVLSFWTTSPYYEAWLLHDTIKTSVVSVVQGPSGYYVSWTFLNSEARDGPARVRRFEEEWRKETGGITPLEGWLRSKGYA